MDTVNIDGKEIPLTEVVAFYARKEQLEAEANQLRASNAAANNELKRSASAVDAIERAKNDPEFARSMVDALSDLHASSAFFVDTPSLPDSSVQDPAVTTPPIEPGVQSQSLANPPAPAVSPENLALARQVEALQRQVDADASQRALDQHLAEISASYPAIDTDALLRAAIERKLPLEHLNLLASDFERERLSGVLKERESNNNLLNGLLLGGGGESMDENLQGIGLSLSAAQMNGDAEVDYAALDTGEALALAFAKHGAPTTI